VAAHGGTIHHEPNAAGGATFVIELPVGADHATREARRGPTGDASDATALARVFDGTSAAGRLAAADGSTPAAARVLVLDDEPSIREFLGRVLARSGYVPVLAATGEAALAIVRSDPPAAILCDHRMAGMSGTEFQAAVTAIDPALARRFAFMSGDVLNPELRDFATERGVHLLAKPFDIATIDETVQALLAVPAG
jgi:CheY-like chemotaxis protein